MQHSEKILKSLLIPILEKDNNYKCLTFHDTFWEFATKYIINYDIDAKPIYEIIYALQLFDPEIVFKKIPQIQNQLIEELAELHLFQIKDKAIDTLILNNNLLFAEKVTFLKNMESAIRKLERNRIKNELPNAFERLTFEITNKEIESVTKKISRDELREKFKHWDKELVVEKQPKIFYSLEKQVTQKKNESKVISLNWIKYAVAACVVFGVGIVIWQNNSNEIPKTNTVVTTKKDTTKTEKPLIIEEPLDAIVYHEQKVQTKILMPSDLGFTPTKTDNSITIIFKDGTENIKKLESLKIENDNNIAGDGQRTKAIDNKLNQLKSNIGKYEFNGKEILIYTNKNLSISVLSLDSKSYFIKKDTKYFHLYLTEKPLIFKEVKDNILIEKLEKISFDNE